MLFLVLRLALDPLDRFRAKLDPGADAVLNRGELLRVELSQEEGGGFWVGKRVGGVLEDGGRHVRSGGGGGGG